MQRISTTRTYLHRLDYWISSVNTLFEYTNYLQFHSQLIIHFIS